MLFNYKERLQRETGMFMGSMYFVTCSFSRQVKCPDSLILIVSKTQEILKKGTHWLCFASLLTNLQITLMQKNFSNMKKQVLQEKNKACNSRPVQVPTQRPAVGADASMTTCRMQKSPVTPKTRKKNLKLLVTFNICSAVTGILSTDNSQRIKTRLKTIC